MSKRPGDPGYAAGWCIHYLGISDGKGGWRAACEKGIEYKTFDPRSRQPCFLTKAGESKPDALPCQHLRRPTPEEIAEHEEWVEARMTMTGQAMKRCRDHAAGKRGVNGVVECPQCKGKLHYSIAGSNGHLWGNCETADCLSWMQ